ncbi:MAG TPA: hypothetical protein H9674_03895 [Firmicutes bacterium]|nr:hypothetical protein [Bacillota bacterium]
MAKNTKERSFDDQMHWYGRVWTAIALCLMLLVPLFVAIYFQASPGARGMLIGAASICIIYLPSSIVEVITYAPMLGTGATYLAFVTGNLTNLKIPCCMTAREIVGTEYGTKENEIISTLSVAASSLVTCTVLILGVLLLAPLRPILEAPVLQPAFDTVVPALFGALGYKYFSKTPLVAVAPFVCMAALCLLVPAAASQVAVLVPVSAVISIVAARVLYVKKKI